MTLGLLLTAPLAWPARAQEAAGPRAPVSPPSRQIFPLWAGPALERGAPLPLPYGIGVVVHPVDDVSVLRGEKDVAAQVST